MAKRVSAQPGTLGLFDHASPAPAPVPVAESRALSPFQWVRVRLVAASLQRDITHFQQVLSGPLVSWDEYTSQVIEANTAMAFALRALVEFLPADLQSLVIQFFDLRGRLILREYKEVDHAASSSLHR